MKDTFRYIEEKEPLFQQFWEDLCNIESPSSDGTGLRSTADLIEAFSKDLGFSVLRMPHKKSGDSVLIEYQPSGATGCIALLAHMDTVHAKGAFGYPPVRREDHTLFGPGVMDCKGGIAVALFSMAAASKSALCQNAMRLILNPDEEDGSFAGQEAISFIQNNVRGCKAAINCEPSTDGFITVGRKGVMHAILHVEGKSAHAGNHYFDGVSAIREAANKVIRIEQLSLEGGITYNCGKIVGGTVSNAVPSNCTVDIDVRFNNRSQQEDAEANLRKITGFSYVEGTRSALEIVHVRPAMECSPANLALFEKASAIAKERDLGRSFQPLIKGGGSDSAYTVLVGVPTICSMGVEGQFEHTIQEEADTRSLARQAKLISALLLDL